jgi:hypothetical protein
MKSKATITLVAVSIALSAIGALAQGPQGTGAAEAAQSGPHISNPVKWIKKQPHTETASLDPNNDQTLKLTAKLQVQGILPTNANLKDTCATIKELNDCVAALHAGRNLSTEFDCLKSKLSGVQARLGSSVCKSGTDGKPVSLTKAIHSLRPDVNASAETKKATEQARDDLRDAGAGT